MIILYDIDELLKPLALDQRLNDPVGGIVAPVVFCGPFAMERMSNTVLWKSNRTFCQENG